MYNVQRKTVSPDQLKFLVHSFLLNSLSTILSKKVLIYVTLILKKITTLSIWLLKKKAKIRNIVPSLHTIPIYHTFSKEETHHFLLTCVSRIERIPLLTWKRLHGPGWHDLLWWGKRMYINVLMSAERGLTKQMTTYKPDFSFDTVGA